jgi:hypothetical protein
MAKTYLWQAPDFPHFYNNPAIAEPLKRAFREAVEQLDSMLSQQVLGFDDVLTEEIDNAFRVLRYL